MLFIRGKAMSGAPIISGTNQLPKPPISVGITMKNTMMRPWPVTKTLKACGFEKNCRPGSCSSRRMAIERSAADDAGHEAEDEVERADILVVRRHGTIGARRSERDRGDPRERRQLHVP